MQSIIDLRNFGTMEGKNKVCSYYRYNKMGIKSVRLISNNICYGPAPAPNDEVEQHLTVARDGRVWFSGRNYQQYSDGKGFCRKKQVNIGPWKAKFLFELLDDLTEQPMATDCGDYSLSIRYDDEKTRTINGPLIGTTMASYHGHQLSATKLLRRYIPVYALWGFDGQLSPDYEGKGAIFTFAKNWYSLFSSEQISNMRLNCNLAKIVSLLVSKWIPGKSLADYILTVSVLLITN